MISGEEIGASHVCKECGATEENRWMKDHAERLSRLQLCFSCDFWLSNVARKDSPKVARIDGTHYVVCRETNERAAFRGFGGHRFRIRFEDGREIETTNLWCQGRIPERFATRLPNNAQFLRHAVEAQS